MSNLKFGWASRDLSTDDPIVITGQAHQRISKGSHDPLTTTALVLERDNKNVVVFVCMDNVGIGPNLVDEVREKTHALRSEIPGNAIMINATHAHTGACHYENEILFHASKDPQDAMPVNFEYTNADDYRHWLSDTMAEMIAEAWDNRSEGGIAYGYGYAVVAHSRRVLYFDDVSTRPGAPKGNNTYAINGHAVMYGNTNDDNFAGYEAGADHFMNVVYTFDKAGKLTGAIINVPCPCQCSEGEWYLSASYWHETRELIRKKYGNIFIMTQCAAGGDLSPRILHYKKAQDRRFALKYGDGETISEDYMRRDIAERIAACFDEVLSWAKNDIRTDMELIHDVSDVKLERTKISKEQYENCKASLEELRATPFKEGGDVMQDMMFNTTLVANRRRVLAAIEMYEQEQNGITDTTMELHTIRLGDIAFATNCYELYMDFQHRIQARSPFEQTFIIQLVGQPSTYRQLSNSYCDFYYYLCTERALEAKGYSASIFCTRVSPKGGQQLVDATVKQLKELYK